MNKNILIIAGVGVIIASISGYLFFNKSTSKNQEVTNSVISEQPDRPAEINGYVISIEGNDLTIANEIGKQVLTDEQKAERQKLSPEERQALRVSEDSAVTKENVSLTVPVGTPIFKGAGTGTGENINADLAEIQKGVYISIWKNEDNIEFIKLKGVTDQ